MLELFISVFKGRETKCRLMGLPVEAGTGIKPASVATQFALRCIVLVRCAAPLGKYGAVQCDWSGVGYSTKSITFPYPNCSLTHTQTEIQ